MQKKNQNWLHRFMHSLHPCYFIWYNFKVHSIYSSATLCCGPGHTTRKRATASVANWATAGARGRAGDAHAGGTHIAPARPYAPGVVQLPPARLPPYRWGYSS